MVLRFLGESVTDSNGLAVLPDGYTGTGAGLVDIVAKTSIVHISAPTATSTTRSKPSCFMAEMNLPGVECLPN